MPPLPRAPDLPNPESRERRSGGKGDTGPWLGRPAATERRHCYIMPLICFFPVRRGCRWPRSGCPASGDHASRWQVVAGGRRRKRKGLGDAALIGSPRRSEGGAAPGRSAEPEVLEVADWRRWRVGPDKAEGWGGCGRARAGLGGSGLTGGGMVTRRTRDRAGPTRPSPPARPCVGRAMGVGGPRSAATARKAFPEGGQGFGWPPRTGRRGPWPRVLAVTVPGDPASSWQKARPTARPAQPRLARWAVAGGGRRRAHRRAYAWPARTGDLSRGPRAGLRGVVRLRLAVVLLRDVTQRLPSRWPWDRAETWSQGLLARRARLSGSALGWGAVGVGWGLRTVGLKKYPPPYMVGLLVVTQGVGYER